MTTKNNTQRRAFLPINARNPYCSLHHNKRISWRNKAISRHPYCISKHNKDLYHSEVSTKKRASRLFDVLFLKLLVTLALSFSLGLYGNNAAVAITTTENNYTVCQSIQSVVLTLSYVLTRIVNRTALANENVACYASLATPNLNT